MYGVIVGRLGADAVFKQTKNGNDLLEFSVVENSWSGEEVATWYKCTLFGKRASSLEPRMLKGTAVSISGQSYLSKWTNQDGEEIKTLRCNVKDVILQGSAPGGQSREPQREPQRGPAPSGGYGRGSQPPTPNPGYTGRQKFEDDIPF